MTDQTYSSNGECYKGVIGTHAGYEFEEVNAFCKTVSQVILVHPPFRGAIRIGAN
jgi:hypothetical protein